ncbi:signal peptidase I [Dorea sp. D27]|uniref:signal peptidase I n=1 Tax=Dorea sp. D27 TaxID=658665 RepID=UPI00067330A0|nr:signal peptidase I [Dorea sp. D27]KMZ53558.1 signal peptidase I [Dorea sp. D27]
MREAKRKKRRLVTVVNILLCAILIPVILINVAVIINSYVHPEEIPGLFGIKPVAVLSGSMEDTFKTGDLIFIRKTDTASLKEGDVICYLESGQAVTHRIARTESGGDGGTKYITKGDANNAEDQKAIEPGQIQGIWTGLRVGGMGNFVLFLSSTTGMIVFIVCPVVLFLIGDIILRWRTDRKEKSRADKLEAELAALKAQRGADN